jgi:hypothetical protein
MYCVLKYIYVFLLVLKCNHVNTSAAYGDFRLLLSSITAWFHNRLCHDVLQEEQFYIYAQQK